MVYSTLFLAGPINGAESWRDKVIKDIASNVASEIIIETPVGRQVYKPDSSGLRQVESLTIFNPQSIVEKEKFTQERHNFQIDWETQHLQAASVIAFNIPKPERVVDDYAKTTRFELGEWIGVLESLYRMVSVLGLRDRLTRIPKIILHTDNDFPGKYYFERRIESIYNTSPELANFIIMRPNYEDFISSILQHISI